jgi:glycosyltransferase involved in cell wall biosynthesis
MNILYFLYNFPTLSESFVINEIYELQKKHNICVFALNKPDENIQHEELEDMNIRVKYAERPRYRNLKELCYSGIINLSVLREALYLENPRTKAANLCYAKQLIDYIEALDTEINLIHSHFAASDKIIGIYAASYLKKPFTITTHALDIFVPSPLTKRILKKSNQIITISNYNKGYIKDNFEVNKPIHIVRAGVRPEKFNEKFEKGNHFITVSRLIEKKGLSYALEAFSKVLKSFPKLEYRIIGSGSHNIILKEKANELGISSNVKFLSNVSDRRLIEEVGSALGFILPCITVDDGDKDGIPVAMMESMALKTPCISTNISGIPELIDNGENGFLVEPKNPDKIAEKIILLIENDDRRIKMGERAREKILMDFNIKKEVQNLEKIFQAVNENYKRQKR